MPSIRDVAKHCGVAPMTVSLVLNKPEKISPATRERVLQAIREMGYRPRAVRTRPAQTDPLTIGVLNQESLTVSGYTESMFRGILMRTYALDQNLLMLPGHRWAADPQHSVRVNCDGRCDGLIFIAPILDDPVLAAIQDRGLAYVIIGEYSDTPGVATVDLDNRAAARLATEHLLTLGHRRIAFLGGLHYFQSPGQRRDGFQAAMAAHGLPSGEAMLDLLDHGESEKAARRLLSRPAEERPTAIFAWNDTMAIQVMRTARTLGLRVPEDCSVVGIDDTPEAASADPPLTTVRQPYLQLGERAVDALLAQIAGGPPEKALLPGELVVRASTGPAPRP